MSRLASRLAPAFAFLVAVVTPVLVFAASPAAEGHAEGHGDGHSAGIEWVTPVLGNTGKTGLLWLFINFAVLMWILNKVLFSKLKVSTAAKSDVIKTELAKATEARSEAESIISEYRGRMDKLDAEVAELMDDAKRRAEADRKDIIEAAKREAARIKATAEAAAEREAGARQQKIENEIVDAAVARAEALIKQKIGPPDQTRMVSDYVDSLGSMTFAGPGGSV